ncbi:MAG: CopG family transcriptional regulator [Bacillota bacterium]|nr:CopG family transcriptional regulator [Bacillota bacterium]
MEYQNITLSIPKETLLKVKHIAIDRQTSVSRLLAKTLEEIVQKEETYGKAKARQLESMEKGLNLGLKGTISWKREELHDRK